MAEEVEDDFPIYGTFNIVMFGDEKSSLNDYMKILQEKNFPDDNNYTKIPFEQVYTPLGRYGISLSMANATNLSAEERRKYIEKADEIWYFFAINQPETLAAVRSDYIPSVMGCRKGIPSFLFGIGSEQHEGIDENDWQSKYGQRIVSKAKLEEFLQEFDLKYESVSLMKGEGIDALRGRLNQVVLDEYQNLQIACVVSCGMESKLPIIPNDFVHSLHIKYNKPFVHVLPIACESDDSIKSAIETFKYTRNIDHITPIIFIGIYENDVFGNFDKEIEKATKNFAQVAQIKMRYPVNEDQIEACIKLIDEMKKDSIKREKEEIAEREARKAREEAERKRKQREAEEEAARQREEAEKQKKKESTCCRI